MGQENTQDSESALSNLDNGVINKDIGKRYKCTYAGCDAVFPRPSRLDRHIRSHLGERPYKCSHPGCNKAYTNSSHLKRHVETHAIIRATYQCTVCQMTLRSQYNLKRHYQRIHGDSSKLTCKDCNIVFYKRHQLMAHCAAHHKVPLKCEICNKLCATTSILTKHKAVHTGTKKYPCPIADCNEIFNKWLLRCVHVKTQHVLDCKCTVCGKIFLNRTHLQRHSLVHKTDRPIILCPFEKCPRFYYFKSNLDNHIKVTHQGNKFECNICSIKLATKQKLAEHIQKLHMSAPRIKKIKKLNRKKRKDMGTKKKSELSALIGVDFPKEVEQMLLQRKSDIEYIEESEASAVNLNS